MTSPVFKLEGVIKEKDDMADFEGPLTLILLLLSKDKIEVRDISITSLLEQYLDFLDEMTEADLDVASEFVAMASHLAYIKTKVLLAGNEEVTELEQLISSLEQLQNNDVYMQIKSITGTLAEMYSHGSEALAGPPEYLPLDGSQDYIHDADELHDAIVRIIGRENLRLSSLNPRKHDYPGKIMYSISDKTLELISKVKEVGEITLDKLFSNCESRSELVATLIALLELCKVGNLHIYGTESELLVCYKASTDYIEEPA